MLRIFIFCSLIVSASCFAQDAQLGYHLDVGKRYSLNISIQQNTFSENYDQGNNISLDLKMTLHFNIVSQLNNDVYYAMVKYDNLFFSMLAPTLKIDINSESGNNAILRLMIDSLEAKSFRIQLGRDGSMVMFGNINAFFYNMYDLDISSEEEQDVIIKTLREAFGNNAFTSIYNLFVNFHPAIDSTRNWEKDYTYYFNTKPVNMVSRFFLIKQTEVQNTVQGIGMISTDEQVLEVIGSEVKKRKDSIESYVSGGREDLAQIERSEIEVLANYLPEQMTDEELEKVVEETISQMGNNPNFGAVMGSVMGKVKGKTSKASVDR